MVPCVFLLKLHALTGMQSTSPHPVLYVYLRASKYSICAF